MGNSISVAEKKIKIEKYIISYIKKNLNKNITYEDIKKILNQKMEQYNLKDKIWKKNYMEGWNIIKKKSIKYKKEDKYLDEKKLVNDYFAKENNITSLNLETHENANKLSRNMLKFLNYLKQHNVNEKLHKYLLDYYYIEKKNQNIFYVEKKIIHLIDITIKKREENLKIRKEKERLKKLEKKKKD
jgi:hypothetical protein